MKGAVLRTACVSLVAMLSPFSAQGAIHKIPLSEMVIGSEVTNSALAPNGEFESHHGFDVRFPNYWNSFNDQVITATPINVPAGSESYFGGYAFQAQPARLDGFANTGYRKQADGTDHWPTALAANTDYVVSAYVWVIGNADHHMRATIDLADVTNELEIRISWDEPHAADGLFVYGTFNTGDIGGNQTRPTLRVYASGKTGLDEAGQAMFPVVVQMDNVRVTPLADFVPPALVPEPAAVSLLALGGLGLLRRRRN